MRLLLALTFLALPCHALTVTLSQGGSCQYSQVATDANGDISVTCQGTPPPPPPPANGCPAVPFTTIQLPGLNATGLIVRAASGQVLSFPMPALPLGKSFEAVAFGETPIANTPSPYSLDMSISTCPGVFNAPTGPLDLCNVQGYSQTNGGTFYWATTQAAADNYLMCYAPEDQPRYMNVRWSYAKCASGASTCGFSVSAN